MIHFGSNSAAIWREFGRDLARTAAICRPHCIWHRQMPFAQKGVRRGTLDCLAHQGSRPLGQSGASVSSPTSRDSYALYPSIPKQKTCSRSSMTYIELMSCSRLNIRHHNELRLPQRYHLRKRMQSWLHRLRPTTHNLRRRPAPCPRSVRRPSMASRLMVRFSNNHGSSSLFTDFLPRLPSRRRHSCSPCTARQKTSSSTTHGPVINHACISSNHPLPLQWRH